MKWIPLTESAQREHERILKCGTKPEPCGICGGEEGGHAVQCGLQVRLRASEMMEKQNREEAAADAEQAARWWSDILEDAYCEEAVFWREVMREING